MKFKGHRVLTTFEEMSMSYCRKWEERIFKWIREHLLLLLGSLLGGALVYFPMMSQDLVNDADGIWHMSNFISGRWEISLGRGLLRYFDKMRFGVVSVPLNTLLALLLFSVSAAMILDMFDVKNKILRVLFTGILITSPVVCATLSYCYTSVNYGIAFLFSVSAAACVIRDGKGRFWIFGGGCIAVSMACYQAYLGVTCLLLLAAFGRMLLMREEIKEIRRLFLRSALSLGCGGVLYLILVWALLFRAGAGLADYRGASSAGLTGMIMNLPDSVRECYLQYYDYFMGRKMYADLPLMEVLMFCLLILCISVVLVQFVRLFGYRKGYAVLLLLCVMLMPAACNAVLMAAVGNAVSILMSAAMAMSISLGCAFLPKEGKMGWGLQRAWCLLAALLLWFQLAAVTNDQLAMKEGKTASIALARNVAGKLISEGYLAQGETIVFVGRPADNPLFTQSTAYQNANAYARFGSWAIDAGNYRRSWMGVLSGYCGMDLNLGAEAQYDRIRQTEILDNMPVFPYEGSIREIENCVVVKISEVY